MRLSWFGFVSVLILGHTVKAQAELVYGLTNLQELITFETVGATRPRLSSTSLTGFSISGEFLIGIDVRPATGELYGLSNQNQLYRVNPTTGVSTLVGPALTGLTGNAKALDFNPTVDRIRILTSGGQNYRVHPDTGALVTADTPLQFAVGDVNAGETPLVVNGAYTNSFAGATTTTLYDLDALNNILTTQAPPNNGTLNSIGSIGFDLVDSAGFTGFDISGQTGLAYLVGNKLGTGGLTVNSLYAVNLTTGGASLLGPVTGFSGSFRDIAVVGPAAVPEPSTMIMSGLCYGAIMLWKFRRQRQVA